MKCLFLLVPQLDYGGQERYVATLSKVLKDVYEVKIITYASRVVGYDTACEVINLRDRMPVRHFNWAKKMFGIRDRIKALRELFKVYRPVACISFGVGANRLNVEARQNNIKVFLSLRSYSSVKQYSKNIIDRLSIRFADGILCVSEQIKEELLQTFPKQSYKFKCMYNAYDMDAIAKEKVSKKSETDKKIHIVSLGRICKEKGYWHIIKAMSLVKKEIGNVVLDIYGTDQYVEHKKNLEVLAEKLNLNDTVCFHGNTNSPYSQLWSSDIYVLSSITEGFPNALVEAMACGLPVIANDCKSGPREILSSKRSPVDKYIVTDYGILTPRLSTDINWDNTIVEKEETIFAEAISFLCLNYEARLRLSKKGPEKASSFSYDSCKKKIIELVEK